MRLLGTEEMPKSVGVITYLVSEQLEPFAGDAGILEVIPPTRFRNLGEFPIDSEKTEGGEGGTKGKLLVGRTSPRVGGQSFKRVFLLIVSARLMFLRWLESIIDR